MKECLENGEDIAVVDARAAMQYEQAHIDCAVNMLLDRIRQEMDTLDKEKTVVTYCNKGVTGNAAQNILINNGFKKYIIYQEGIPIYWLFIFFHI